MNPKHPRVKKTKAELLEDLAEQIELLTTYCEAFDAGKHSMVKPMSASLKVLLYGDKGKSLALLHQLGLRQRRFIDTAQPIPNGSTFAQCQLAGIYVPPDSHKVAYVPLLSDLPHPILRTAFADWWATMPVVRDMQGRTFTRLELVQEVRDTDGGAHLDAELNERYADFKSGRYMGWKVRTPEGLNSIQHPHLACLRQITHEVVLTLQEIVPEQFRSPYTFSLKPMDGKFGAFLFGTQIAGNPGSSVPILKIGDTELVGEL